MDLRSARTFVDLSQRLLIERVSFLSMIAGFLNFQPKEARGVDKTTGKADINYVSEDEDDYEEDEDWEERFSKNPTSYDDEDDVDGRKTSLGQSVVLEEGEEEDEEEAREPSPRPASPVPAPTNTKDEGRQRSDSVSSKASTSSSSSSVSSRGGGSSDDYSDSKADDEAPKKEETKVVSIVQEQQDSGNEVEIPVGSGEVNEAPGETRPVETEVEVEEKKEVEKEEITPEESTKVSAVLSQPSSSSISSSSSSSGSAAIHDRGPNTVNDPTSIEDKEEEREQEREEMEKLENQKAEDLRANAPPLISIQDAVEPQQEHFKGTSSNEPPPSVENGRSSNDPPVFVQEVVESPNEVTKEPKKSKKDSDSSSSESGSDSSSDSDSDNTSKEPSKENSGRKEATIETKADVHLDNDGRKFNYGTFEEAESDPEQTHGGSDPDNVANDNGTTVKKTIDPVPLGHPREGSIVPLLEANQNAIEIKGVTLNKTQVYEVAEFLEKSKKLNTVTLVNCGIDDDDVQKIMEGLRDSSSNPVMLNLSLNPLTVTSVYHILKTVEIKNSVEAVLLQGTRLGDDGVNSLVDGIMSLYEIVKENPEEKEKGIHELDLSDSKFGDEGAVAIARLLKSEVDMDTVTLSHNHAISLDGWRTIGESLRDTQHLETLTLDHNFIGDEGMEVIAAGLHTNSSLTALDINDVGITDTGAKCLMNMLKENTVLLEIVMMDNKISDSIGENIQKYISLNKAASSN